jgi:hypothetical protein
MFFGQMESESSKITSQRWYARLSGRSFRTFEKGSTQHPRQHHPHQRPRHINAHNLPRWIAVGGEVLQRLGQQRNQLCIV